jgi:hypothetical protein
MLPNDREEFVELFPALAAEVTYEAIEDRLSKIPVGNNDPKQSLKKIITM